MTVVRKQNVNVLAGTGAGADPYRAHDSAADDDEDDEKSRTVSTSQGAPLCCSAAICCHQSHVHVYMYSTDLLRASHVLYVMYIM